MQDMTQALVQPFMRLAQANLQLFTQFSSSPEMVTLFMNNAQKMLWPLPDNPMLPALSEGDAGKLAEQTQRNVVRMAQSDAFGDLLKGMMQNYLRFLIELNQGSMSLFGPATAGLLMGQVLEAAGASGEAVGEGAPRGGRRHR